MASVKKRKCTRCGKMNAVHPKRLCATCRKLSKKESLAKVRNTRAQKVYGLRDGDYQLLWNSSPHGPGTCWICGGKGSGKLHVEHNHKTGAVRGLCCYTCNVLVLARIGKDNADRLEMILTNAVEYLRTEPAQQILKHKD